MSEGNGESPERTPRYHCRNAPAVSIALERGSGADQVKAPADLLDISSEGAKICVPVPVESDEEIRLRIKHHDSGLNLPIPAAVRWVQHDEEATWRLGCYFLTPLPEDTLQTLASLGCLECADLARLPVAGELAAWKELDPSALSVQLVDLSRGGLSLISPEPAVIGQRMRLLSDGPNDRPTEVFVHVRCCAEVAQGYLIGCQFQDNRVYEALRGAVAAPDPADKRSQLFNKVFRQSQLISRTTILILGGVLIGMAIRTPQPFFIMVLALVSVVAYLALELVAQGRLHSANSRWSQFFAELIEQRLENRLKQLQGGWMTRPMIAMSAEEAHHKPKRPDHQETGRRGKQASTEAAAAEAELSACAAGQPELAAAFDNDEMVT